MGKQVIAAPPPSTGIKWEDFEGRLFLIEPLEEVKGLTTVHSKVQGDTTAVRANVYVRSSKTEWTDYEDTLIFPKILQSQTRRQIGSLVVGRLTKDASRKQAGKNAPWVLGEANAADLKLASEYWTSLSIQSASNDAEDEGYEDATGVEDGEESF